VSLLFAALTSILAGVGVYLLLSRTILRVVLGLVFLSYAANLAILAAGGLRPLAPPLLGLRGPYVDPLPQALILTAIVIGFGTTALLLTLAFRSYQETKEADLANLLDTPPSPLDPLPDMSRADPDHPTEPEEPLEPEIVEPKIFVGEKR
jgi:multicomponent Na+:H+ antiporter subunit C